MKHFAVLLLFPIVLFFTACGSGHNHEHGTVEFESVETEGSTFEVSDAFKEELESALDHYFALSDALVRADASNATIHAQAFRASINAISASEFSDEAGSFWSEKTTVATERSQILTGLQDIEEQRYQFEYISEAMIEVVQVFGPLSFTVYQQRCPMVRGGSADWLSKESAILNPYHGDRMLRCGGIVREI
jgi:hypothetical protein